MKLEEISIQCVKLMNIGFYTMQELADAIGCSKRRIIDIIHIFMSLGIIQKRNNSYKMIEGNKFFKTLKMNITTSGKFIKVQNKGREVYIESTSPDMKIVF